MLSGVRLKQKIAPYAQRLRGVGHISRVSILYLLAHEPMTLGAIAGQLKCSLPLVSHHVQALYKSGWVTRTKYGKLVTYYIEPGAFAEFQKFILSTPFGREIHK